MYEGSIIEHIPKGRANAITRKRLCDITGYSDRVVRGLIEQARRGGAIIVNMQNGDGYYQSDDIHEIAKQYEQNEHRALSILAQQKHLRRRLKAAGMLRGREVLHRDDV